MYYICIVQTIKCVLYLSCTDYKVCTIFAVYRQGDTGRNWYAVLSGSLDVNVSELLEDKVCLSVCSFAGHLLVGS